LKYVMHVNEMQMDLPAHQPSMTVLMTPDIANFSGNVHGGTILKLLDQVATPVLAAMRGVVQ
jgi:acyl-CoA hydrolase